MRLWLDPEKETRKTQRIQDLRQEDEGFPYNLGTSPPRQDTLSGADRRTGIIKKGGVKISARLFLGGLLMQ